MFQRIFQESLSRGLLRKRRGVFDADLHRWRGRVGGAGSGGRVRISGEPPELGHVLQFYVMPALSEGGA